MPLCAEGASGGMVARPTSAQPRPHALAVSPLRVMRVGSSVADLCFDRRRSGDVGAQAQRRVQITLADGGSPAQAIHEDRGDGTPVCNSVPEPFARIFPGAHGANERGSSSASERSA